MLIENNLIDSKKIIIDIVNKFAYIESYNVIVNLKIKTNRTIIYKQVHIKKTINVVFEFEITISIYYTSISSNRDFFFESNKFNLSIYIYLVNFETRNIVVRNNSNKTIYILRNCQLRRIIELEFFNVFYIVVNSNVLDLTLRKAFANYKSN